MWYNKDQICQEPGKLIEPSQAGGNLFNIHDSHSLGEIALKGLANTGAYFAKKRCCKSYQIRLCKKENKKCCKQIS